ncbi:hypothetical protein K435DRAFT_772011 [Dendrothele bispora CBS 962.96]|uniref:Uncharacterized protein n=1 Tax=Dendrothele bispora (strain CBS 962.96) TaxID=1314807 RepID=A0A4S8MYK7_DENBC|nr:hypothetical protein K435DRAFT_772011 [Dendrothele bispora CBS 962.96]
MENHNHGTCLLVLVTLDDNTCCVGASTLSGVGTAQEIWPAARARTKTRPNIAETNRGVTTITRRDAFGDNHTEEQ